MAEDSDKKYNKKKLRNTHFEEDLIPQADRKRIRSSVGGLRTKPVGLQSSRPSPSSSHTSSKTVAAILKQQKDLVIRENVSVSHSQLTHQLFPQKQSSDESVSSSISGLQEIPNYVKSMNSPLNLDPVGSSSSANISPAQSPSNTHINLSSINETNHLTTKSSSLSRDLSPSRITAQIVKVMSDTSQNSTQNLLLSVLQGTMPDPMGILSTPKSDVPSLESSVVQTCSHSIPLVTGMSAAGKNISSVSTLISQHDAYPATPLYAAGVFPNQTSNVDDDRRSSSEGLSSQQQVLCSTVNLLTASAGSVQTINVSHIPKTTNIPSALNPGSSLTSGHSLSSSPRHSPRSAMEVAQQIKLEANGQTTSTQRAAMQQQLRSQIKGSRSLDAQLASSRNSAAVISTRSTDNHSVQSHQLPPSKDLDQQKTLEASMPLLASKLSSTPSSPVVSSNSGLQQHGNKAKQSLPLTASLLKSQLSTSNSSIAHGLSMANAKNSPLSIRKSALQNIPSHKSLINVDNKSYNQQYQFFQHQSSSSMTQSSMSPSIESVAVAVNRSLSLTQTNAYLPSSVSSSVGTSCLNEHNKQPMLEKLIHSSDILEIPQHAFRTDDVMKVEGPASTSNLGFKHACGVTSTHLESNDCINNKSILNEANVLSQTVKTAHLEFEKRKSGPGETKQTAIDVDGDFGNLSSIDHQRNSSQLSINANLPGGLSHIPSLKEKELCDRHNTSYSGIDNMKMPSASLIKDIAGRSDLSCVDISSFHSVHSTPSSLKPALSTASQSLVQIAKPPIQSLKPISYPYSTTASVDIPVSSVFPSLLQPIDYNGHPPPPYPSNLSHDRLTHKQTVIPQQQQIHQIERPSVKQSARNPFTFPTTGVKVQTGHDSSGLLSYTIYPEPLEVIKDSLQTEENSSARCHRVSDKSQQEGIYYSDFNPERWTKNTRSDIPHTCSQSSRLLDEESHFAVNTADIAKKDEEPLVQPFNQRVANLSCLPVTNAAYRASYRSHAMAVQRARSGVITNTAKTLDVLRQNLQRNINKEISDIIKKYTRKFFEPALVNVRQNSNEELLGNEHINHVCRQILEEAKCEYSSSVGRRSITPTIDTFDAISDNGSTNGRKLNNLKRSRISDSDSEKGSDAGSVRKTIKRKGRPPVHGSGRVTPSKTIKAGDSIKKEGPKWNPDRLKLDTLFIMGAKANKALGLGNTRGRLYIRHPDIFKYVGDSEDKLWLCDRSLMPPTGGKAYLMLVEDIEDLSRSEDYRDSPCMLMHECVGFTVPEWMLVKMKEQMGAQRTDGHKKRHNIHHDIEGTSAEACAKPLPFSTFADIKVEAQPSPAGTEDIEFLPGMDCDEHRQSTNISLFNITDGFDETGEEALSPADLGTIDDGSHMSPLFT